MKTRIAAVLAFGAVAPVSSAMALSYDLPRERVVPATPYDDLTTGSVGAGEGELHIGWCVPSSAREGNGNQQTRPVMQYGQITGGSRC